MFEGTDSMINNESMDNLHVRLNFNLCKEEGIKHHMQLERT
jgi:hypothetical protein